MVCKSQPRASEGGFLLTAQKPHLDDSPFSPSAQPAWEGSGVANPSPLPCGDTVLLQRAMQQGLLRKANKGRFTDSVWVMEEWQTEKKCRVVTGGRLNLKIA